MGGKWNRLRRDTLDILAMPNHLTNRQVSDILQCSLEKVKEVRRRHNVDYNKTPRDRGLRNMIREFPLTVPTADVAQKLGCCITYVSAIRREMKSEQR